MAETRLTNVIVPEIFSAYTLEPWYERSRTFQSGIIQPNSNLNALLDGGGKIFDMPFWKPLEGDTTVPTEATAETVNAITSGQQDVRRQLRNKAYGANAISGIEAGDEPLNRFANDVKDFWTKAYNKNLINSAAGVLADNVANDSSDLLQDDSAVSFNDNGIIDSQSKLGENGVVGRGDSEDFVGIAVHPAIYNSMRKNDLIDFVAISGQLRPLAFYNGMEVIVDDQLPLASSVYTSVLFKSGAFQFGVSSARYMPTELDRDATKGMGIDNVYTRRVFAVHPVGFQWADSSVAGVSPTDAELAAAANWDRVYNKENIRMTFYKSLV